jgi:outer membrane protein OmpA-like peptidoglycan-associated protein
MSVRAFTIGMAALVLAVPAAAQQRGTMEFGAFGSGARFDEALSLKTGYGGGGRIGMYLDPRWAIEFEDAEMRATRPNGLKDVNVGILSGRLVYSPFTIGRMAVLLGAGAGVSTETNFMHTYGVDALLGLKMGLTPNVALRIDGVYDWLANEDWKSYQSVRVGLSVYRHPRTTTRTVTVTTQAPPVMMNHQDSVSAAETRRLRQQEATLRALQDSLRNAPAHVVSCDEAAMTRISFAAGQQALPGEARMILDGRVRTFADNAALPIMVHAHHERGASSAAAAQSVRNAEATKSYLVSRGIAAGRITVLTGGEREPTRIAVGKEAALANACSVFRVAIAPDVAAR